MSWEGEYYQVPEPFDIVLALLGQPSVDVYRRAEDAGITAVMCRPRLGQNSGAGGVDACRESIEQFAENIIEVQLAIHAPD